MRYSRTVKAAAVAAAAVWAAVALLLVGPAAAAFVAAELPRAHSVAATWLTPPYLYLLINAIILSIAASSRFHNNRSSAASSPELEQAPSPAVIPVVAVQTPEAVAVVEAEEVAPPELKNGVPEPEEEEFLISRSTWAPKPRETEVVTEAEPEMPFADLTNSSEKPLVSARFGHRKAPKPSPEGSRALRVARPRKEETLESTWKAITEGRAPPLTRHLKKSDTWETRSRRLSGGLAAGEEEEASPAAPAMRKADTFNEGNGGGGERRVKREPSLGQDELNRRVEAFIKKFNEEMRLQRQESFNQYLEMINKGSH